jgi:hypothetical protein
LMTDDFGFGGGFFQGVEVVLGCAHGEDLCRYV